MNGQIISGCIGALLAGMILYLVRRDHLHGSYALWWLAIAAAILILGVFPPLVDQLGNLIGIYYPPVLPIIVGIGMILVRMLKMDIDRSRQELQLRRLTQKLAILEQEMHDKRRGSGNETASNESMSDPVPRKSARVIALPKSGDT